MRRFTRTLLLVTFVAISSATSVAAVEPMALVAAVSNAQSEQVCELLDHGPYVSASPRVHYADSGSVTGGRFEIDAVRFTKQTKLISMVLGRGFGIRYRLDGLPTHRPVLVTWRISYPRPGIRSSPRWEYSFRESTSSGDLVQHLLYDFDYDWEMVAGSWRFQVLVDGQPTCSFTFQVE